MELGFFTTQPAGTGKSDSWHLADEVRIKLAVRQAKSFRFIPLRLIRKTFCGSKNREEKAACHISTIQLPEA